MDLWVCSQDRKELIKINHLVLMYEEIRGVIDNGHYIMLGTYNTKERALEVLDEIQNHILNLGETALIYGKEYKEYGRIYQMPKE